MPVVITGAIYMTKKRVPTFGRRKQAKVLSIEWLGERLALVSFRRGEWESELLAMRCAGAVAVHLAWQANRFFPRLAKFFLRFCVQFHATD
jgi:hypothetical protein